MSIKELYTKGTKIWLPDADEVWKCATLLDDYVDQKVLNVQLEDGKELKVKINSPNDLPHLRNPEVLIGENDLTSLSYLHEPAVLYNLQVRFCERNYIYTYCGIVLVAFNPYQQLPIYDNGTIRAYSSQDMNTMDPHIFAIAEEAFKRMSRFEENQSIIVSGESGAGKTVSAKYAMRYFATVCGAEDETQIEKRVLATNPIMEAIGNAKTTRNDNSSRFGKYIEIGFSKKEHILGANMRTYLLEKSRVVFQAPDERNYHIFYQLCSAADDPAFKQFHLDNSEEFHYTNQGSSTIVDSLSDSEDFLSFCQALNILGMNQMKQAQIFRILAGILHLGNITFKQDLKSTEACFIPEKDKHMLITSKLFGVDMEQLSHWLCHKKMVTVNEVLAVPLTVNQAAFSRDALSKHIYSNLFLWIVNQLNKSLSSVGKSNHFIGVLDIYGFETFEINSFEQFCINYANEKLQQQFCLHVFKLEQEEYVREQIEWSFIDFYDNQACINLIESKLGILDLLDEECKMVNGSDENWCQKLYVKHSKNKHFSKPRMSQNAFIIHHFADDVVYQIHGFLDKNRDRVLEEHINIFKASEYELIAELFQDDPPPTSTTLAVPKVSNSKVMVRSSQPNIKGNVPHSKHSKTVGSQFSESLSLLMETLFSTTPHYVRCIKPNDSKLPFTFDPVRSVQQLRACGVLETIRISAAGYPSRWTYSDFFKRYRVLSPSSKMIDKSNLRKTCEATIAKLINDTDKYQLGKTKIFFRAGQVAYLEKLRSDKLKSCIIKMQKVVRGWLMRRKYQKMKKLARLLQTCARGLLARRKADYLRRCRASTYIRAAWLACVCRRKYLKMRSSIIKIQSYGRSMLARKNFSDLHVRIRVSVIQRFVRGWYCRRRFKMVVRGITKAQGLVRKMMAKKQLRRLKIEAKSTEHIKTKGLENKIIELQQKLDEKAKEINLLKEEKQTTENLRSEVSKLRDARKTSTAMIDHVGVLELKIDALTEELEAEKKEKERLLHEKEGMRREKDGIINHLNNERELLKNQIETITQELKAHVENQEDVTRRRIEEANMMLRHEIEMERTNHQRLIKEHTRVQQRLDNLQSDSTLYVGTPRSKRHRRTPSNLSDFSLESEGSGGDKNEADSGIGCAKKKDRHLDNDNDLSPVSENSMTIDKNEVPLVMKLQRKVKELEIMNRKYRDDLNRRDFPHQDAIFAYGNAPLSTIYEAFKLQELEIENASIRNQLSRLQKVLTESASNYDVKGGKTRQLFDHFEALKEELKHKHNEVARLKTLLFKSQEQQMHSNNLATPTTSSDSMSPSSPSSSSLTAKPSNEEIILNEDGELNMAYESQKKLNQLLETELQRLQEISMLRDQDFLNQIGQLNKDIEKQRKLIDENIDLAVDAKLEATVLSEVTRVTTENLSLQNQIDSLHDSIKKLKKAVKIYTKRLKEPDVMAANMELEQELAQEANMPLVKYHQERHWTAMLEYKKEDENYLIRNLILDLKPESMLKERPHLPSFILFMCIRHTDYMNDDDKVRGLLTNSITNIKRIVKKSPNDLGRVTAWLVNSLSLLNCLKQYSGEKVFQAENTAKQNEHCLKNFDLSEYRQILNDLVVWVYHVAVKYVESKIQNMIVSAILENESISGCSTGKPTSIRQVSSHPIDGVDEVKTYNPDDIIKIMNDVMQNLCAHNADSDVIRQLFRQVFYFICSTALNTLLLRKDLCHWMKAVQIRYNVSQLEQWVRDNKLQDGGVTDSLEPLVQATQLLQARKTEADVDSICDVCSKLTMPQIIKILNLYTPVNEFEERVPMSFIRKVQEKMNSQQQQQQQQPDGQQFDVQQQQQQQSLMMDTKYFYTVNFEFKASNVCLEQLDIPESWGLGFLKKI